MAGPAHQLFSQMFQQDFLNYRDYTNKKLRLIDEKMEYFISEMNELLKQKGLDTEKFTAITNEEDDVKCRRRNNIVEENEHEKELKHLKLVFPIVTEGNNVRIWIEDFDETNYDGTPIYDEYDEYKGTPIYDE